jgi:hypothetical protein
MNSYDLSFCRECGLSTGLVEFTTNTEEPKTIEEKMVILIDEMLEELAQAKNTIDELIIKQELGIKEDN